MRYAVEQRLMRVDGNERELDKSSCDLMLKARMPRLIPIPRDHSEIYHLLV